MYIYVVIGYIFLESQGGITTQYQLVGSVYIVRFKTKSWMINKETNSYSFGRFFCLSGFILIKNSMGHETEAELSDWISTKT